MKTLLTLLALLAFGAAPSARALDPASDKIVVVISVDGLAHYYFDDPKAEMPTIHRLAAEGARAKMMRASMPTVTWPNHTTLVTGVNPAKHGVIGNSYLDRATGKTIPLLPDPIFNKEEIVKSPTIYDVAKQAGLKTAAIVWPASRGAKTLDWTVPDVGTNALFQQYGTASLLEEFKKAEIPYEKQEEYWKTGKGQDRDRMYVQMLNLIVRTHRPQLALLHLVELDHVEHAKGPQTPDAYATAKFEDDRVREVWEELQKSFPGKATLIVTSDHGFFPYQQLVQPNVLLRREGLLQAEGTKITGGQVRCVNQGGSTFLYVLDSANREALIKRLVLLFKPVEGIDLVLTPAEYPTYGMADPKENPQMADLVLAAKSGYSFSDSLAGDLLVTPKSDEVKGTHGYDSKQPGMHASFVAWGVGIKPGVTLGLIDNTSVAPTVAALLGISMPTAEGPLLKEILAEQQPAAPRPMPPSNPDKIDVTAPPPPRSSDTGAGWIKYEHNPILGGEYGTCFDVSVLQDNGLYRMWVSWRPKGSIALVESHDGFHFSGPPKIVLGPTTSGWEDAVNRICVIKRGDGYHMWYTGQSRGVPLDQAPTNGIFPKGHSAIGYAKSPDGINWTRVVDRPVLVPDAPWEKVAVMAPDVMWDEAARQYRMWYSAGEQLEPNAIGHATSPDGITWTKSDQNPVFTGDRNIPWEKERATACHIVKQGDWFYFFYIGFRDIEHAQIGVARSSDGISNWERLPQNPIVRSGDGKWDHDACYKPYTIFDGSKWLLWYNGRRGMLEQIGVVTHQGEDLGFGASPKTAESP